MAGTDKKHKRGNAAVFSRYAKKLLLLIPNVMRLSYVFSALITYEARLAGKSLFNIVLLTSVVIMFLISAWICLLGLLLTYFVFSLQWSWLFAVSTLFAFNLIGLIIAMVAISKSKHNLFFPETRRELQKIKDDLC